MAKSIEDNKLDADFVYSIASLLMQQIRIYEKDIEKLQKECNELKDKLKIIQSTPLDQISITIS